MAQREDFPQWQHGIDPQFVRRMTRPLRVGLIRRDIAAGIQARLQKMLRHVSLADEIGGKWGNIEGVVDGALPLALAYWMPSHEGGTAVSHTKTEPTPQVVVIVQRHSTRPNPATTHQERIITHQVERRIIQRNTQDRLTERRIIQRDTQQHTQDKLTERQLIQRDTQDRLTERQLIQHDTQPHTQDIVNTNETCNLVQLLSKDLSTNHVD